MLTVPLHVSLSHWVSAYRGSLQGLPTCGGAWVQRFLHISKLEAGFCQSLNAFICVVV